MYIGDWMERGARYWPEALAVVDVARGEAGRLTYLQLNRRADRLANWLSGVGVGQGDRVALLAHNGVEYLDLFFAACKLGAIFVPFNFRLHPAELQELVEQVGPKVLVHGPEFVEAAAHVRERCPMVASWLHTDGQGVAGSRPYEAVLQGAPATPASCESVREEDLACLLFTGGTTGRSRGAMISHRMIAWNILTTVLHELQRGDVTITHTPMFHTGGLLVYTLPLLSLGGTVILMRRWDPELMLELVAAEKVTLFFAVPAQYQQLLQAPGFARTDFSSVRFLTSGGAPLPVQVMEEFGRAHRTPFKQGFGMTEFGPGIFSMGAEFAVRKAGSIGRPNYFVDARIEPLEAGGEAGAGELLLRGPALFSGYYGDAAATAAAIDAAGWYHTGDVCRVDGDGFYYVVDRKKDMFISGGENVYPVEIERVLYQHPAVLQCAVVGSPDERWGQVGRAFVVPRPGTQPTPDELLAFLGQNLARYKVPKVLELRESLPVSPAGKILKRELL